MAKSYFKQEHDLEKRRAEAARIREKYPDRIPVIVEKAERSDIPSIDKKKFSMDVSKDWMDTPRHEKEYQLGVERFLQFAFSSVGVPQGEEIQCPCAKCFNILWLKREVYDHLICNGFVKGYRRWFNHGESFVAMDVDSDTDGEYHCNDNIDELLRNRFRDNVEVEGQNVGPNFVN